jgi:ABC-type transport system involved in cytochrome c biogenesis permease component
MALGMLVKKELRSVLTGGDLAGVLFFTLAAVVTAAFAFRFIGVPEALLPQIAVAAMYLVFTFAGVVATRLVYRGEAESGGAVTLQVLGFSAGRIFLSKLLALWLLLFMIQLVTSLLTEQFLAVSFAPVRSKLILISALLSLGFAEVGVLLGLLSLAGGIGERMLSLALLPFTLPLLYSAVILTLRLNSSGQLDPSDFWLHLLAGLAVIYGAAGAILSDYFLLG